jgi:hypothetical protein
MPHGRRDILPPRVGDECRQFLDLPRHLSLTSPFGGKLTGPTLSR